MKQLLRGTHHPECPRQCGSTQCYCSALYVRDRMDQYILSLYTDKTQSGRTDTMRETVTTAYDLFGLVRDFKRLNRGHYRACNVTLGIDKPCDCKDIEDLVTETGGKYASLLGVLEAAETDYAGLPRLSVEQQTTEGPKMNVEDTIAERAETHGDYKTQALTAQGLKSLMRKAPNWDNMPPALMESLDLIATKISRILHGDPETVEHWLDGEGYFRLGRRVVENE